MNTVKQVPGAGTEKTGVPDLKIMSEKVLVGMARDRSEAAVRELVRRLNPRLFRVARGIVNNESDAEEVVQEAYLKGFSQLEQFLGRASFTTWMTRITVNSARMRLRTTRPAEEYDTVDEQKGNDGNILPFPGNAVDQPDAALGRGDFNRWLETAVAELPDNLRLVFLLRESEGMSTLAIARDLSLNPVTVKTRLFRARRQLRARLERKLNGGFQEIFPFDGARCVGMADRVVVSLRQSGFLEP